MHMYTYVAAVTIVNHINKKLSYLYKTLGVYLFSLLSYVLYYVARFSML